ncbi:MAG TPA: hypothetical protein VNA24_17625 [Hyalangium sp.]|nr:hypothetical protein [Hyalangium sp.]
MNLLRSQGTALAGLILSTLLASACDAPPVVATDDRQQQTEAARIEGSVVVTGPARGNAVVFLYDAERPPPPQGAGRPVAFTLIPQEELFGSDLANNTTGPFTAPFIFPLVRPGHYLLRGFIDVDTCRSNPPPCHGPDFIPWYNVTAEPNVGDVAGAAVDLATRLPRVIDVGVTEDGVPVPVLGVTVSFSETSTVTADRPVFEVQGATPISASSGPVGVRLHARPIREGAVNLSAPIFLVRFVDEDRDNVPDDANKDGQPDLWPRIVVRKLAENGVQDENDLDNNGVLDAQGVDYVHEDNTQDGQPDLVVLATSILMDSLPPGLYDTEGQPIMSAVLPVTDLNLGVLPIAIDARNPANLKRLKSLPPGRYGVTVIQSTGQVWRVPNELSPMADDVGLPRVDGQGFSFQVR